jgi:adenosylhomocysteine nucleosidase
MRRLQWCFLALLLGVVRLGAVEAVDVLLVATDDASLQPVLAKVADSHSTVRGAWTVWTGQLGSKRVSLTRAEGDPLNAVAATTLAIRLHPPKLVIVFGPGRAHDAALKSGDIVVSEKFAAFDGLFSKVTALEAGIHPLSWEPLPHLQMTAGEQETPAMTFPADAAAASTALKVTNARGRVVAGVLGSAHQINREVDRIAWLRSTWHTSTEDGGSAHVAGCAALLSAPVVGICVVDARGGDAADFAMRLVEALP